MQQASSNCSKISFTHSSITQQPRRNRRWLLQEAISSQQLAALLLPRHKPQVRIYHWVRLRFRRATKMQWEGAAKVDFIFLSNIYIVKRVRVNKL